MEILCFIAGTVFFYSKSLYAPGMVLLGLYFKAPRTIVFWFTGGLLCTCLHQLFNAEKNMPDAAVVRKTTVTGRVFDVQEKENNRSRVVFDVERLNNKPAKSRILVSCYSRCPAFIPRQIWTLTVKLKRPRNLGNPGYFDYVGMLKARHIQWTASLKSHTLLQDAPPSLRQSLAHKFSQNLNQETSAIFKALTVGISSDLSQAQWGLFRRTGTTHLMVISGAHIALAGGGVYWLVRKIWTLFPALCLRFPAGQIAGIWGVLAAFLYTILSGFGIPSQRALTASCFLMLQQHFKKSFTSWQAWRYALLIVVILEPHAVFLPGFYLSFIAVGVLRSAHAMITYGGIKKLLSMQFYCLTALLPFTLYWFSYASLNSLLANLFAIPWTGFVMVPLSFLYLLLADFNSTWLIQISERAVDILSGYLKWVDQFSFLNIEFYLKDLKSFFALVLAIALLLFMRLRSLYPAALVLIISAFYPSHPQVKYGEALVDVIDVGQGLAVLIRTGHHALLYDTGGKFYQGSDMGKLAVLPYLKTLGLQKIDKIVISHPDLDHRGGLTSIEAVFPPDELLVDHVDFYRRGVDCQKTKPWVWEGVKFNFFPIKQTFKGKNNTSCVLKVDNKHVSILLPGDIEKPAEYYLLKKYGQQLRSDVLVLPHHGSKSSSSADFLKKVSPEIGVISSGFDNRYHFPHIETLETMKLLNIDALNTADKGMISLKLSTKLTVVPRSGNTIS